MPISNVLHAAIIGSCLLLTACSTSAVHKDQVGPSDHGAVKAPIYINSTPEAYAGMLQLPMDEPFHMLNLIRFKDKASYETGSDFAAKNRSGEEAYAEYTRRSSPIVTGYGAKAVYLGQPQLTVIGPEQEKWDVMFVVSYPNYKAFTQFLSDPEYKKHAFHRSAAVADSRLVRIAPAPPQP